MTGDQVQRWFAIQRIATCEQRLRDAQAEVAAALEDVNATRAYAVVVSTDPGSVRDFQAFAKQTGNELLDQQTVGTEYIHILRRR